MTKVIIALVFAFTPLTFAQAAHLLRGSDAAKVQVVVYGDLQCPFSSRVVGYADQLQADFGNQMGFSFAHFPLSFHAQAMPASIAAYCAGEQGKAAEFIIEASKNYASLNPQFYTTTAKNIGVGDLAAFADCQTSASAKTAVESERDAGDKLGVNSTPTVYINGDVIKGAYPYEHFKAAIEKALN